MLAKLLPYFASSQSKFPTPQKISSKITHTMLSNIFIFVKKFKLQSFTEIMNIVAKFWKDSIFRAETFAEILTKLSGPQHSEMTEKDRLWIFRQLNSLGKTCNKPGMCV